MLSKVRAAIARKPIIFIMPVLALLFLGTAISVVVLRPAATPQKVAPAPEVATSATDEPEIDATEEEKLAEQEPPATPTVLGVAAAEKPAVTPKPVAATVPAPTAERKLTPADGLAYWPSAANTGVPKGVTLTPSLGFTIKKAGTVIDGLDVKGCITVKASNVTIKNTRITNAGKCGNGVVNTGYDEYKNIVLTDVEIDGNNDLKAFLVGHGNFTCTRCDLHGGFSSAHPRSKTLIQDSYLHDQADGGSAAGRHTSGVGFHGGREFKLIHNRVECKKNGCSAALSLYGNFQLVEDVLIQDNYFAGGSYCTYAGSLKSKKFPYAKNTKFIDNAFAPVAGDNGEFGKCGRHGPVTSYEPGNGNYWGGNYWLDANRTPVPYDPKKGPNDH